MVAQTRHTHAAPHRLDFRDKLVGKGLSTDALLKKLQTLHTQLAALDQDTVDTNSLNTARKELIHTSLLLHKDRGVKAYTACCLADILRLYAPDAPYTPQELRDIFQFFFRQLSNGLKGGEAAYYEQYFHLLESLSTVKSVVLVCDLPSADELMVEVFRDFFALVRRDLSKKVEMFMTDILVALVDEAQTLPSEVLDTILAQFTDKNARNDQPAYRLAVSICNETADKLQRNVCQYFSDIISSHSPSEDDDPDETQQRVDDLRTAHELIKSLHRSCSGVLHSVIPLLDEELRADDTTIRTLATQTLGDMFSSPTPSAADLMRKYPGTWTMWLSRKADKAVPIRLKVVEACKGLIVNRPEAREKVEAVLREKILDPDEKVRAAVCRVYGGLDYESALHHVSVEQLRAVAGRGLDKRHSVRVEALNCVGRLYDLAYPEIEANDPSAITQFAWIPEDVLKITSTSPEVRNVVDQVLADHLLPLPTPSSTKSKSTTTSSSPSKSSTKGKGAGAAGKDGEVDEVAWTERLLTVMRYLSEKSVKALVGLSGVKAMRPSIYQVYIESCVQYNGGIMDENEEQITRKLNAAVQHLAASLPDPHKAQEDLHAFAKLNENRLYKLARTCMDPQTDVKGLVKATNDFTRRLDASASTLLPTLTAFLRRASFRTFNTSSVPTLLAHLRRAHGSTAGHLVSAARCARGVLVCMARWAPGVYRGHLPEIVKCVMSGDGEGGGRDGGRGVDRESLEVGVQALAGVVHAAYKEKQRAKDKGSVEGGMGEVVLERRVWERLEDLASGGEVGWRVAKFAVRCLVFGRGEGCVRVAKAIADEIQAGQVTEEKAPARVAALVQLARYAPEVFERHSAVFMGFVVKGVLMVPVYAPDDMNTDEGDDEWFEADEVPPALRAKVLALKVCRWRALVAAAADKDKDKDKKGKEKEGKEGKDRAMEIATPTLKMCATMLEHNGSLVTGESEGGVEDPRYLSRLRLQAATSLLHLATVDRFAAAITPKFLRLAVVIQDACYNVRYEFLAKLLGMLQARRLPGSYNVVVFLTVHDPEEDVRGLASAYVENAKKRLPDALRVEHLELSFLRFLHLLAHHPDFSTAHEDLVDITKYVQFYLGLVATQDNIALLQHLALKAKTVRDAESGSENLYIMAELAQELIKKRAAEKGWMVPTYPGKVRLPSDILRPLPSPEASKEVLKTTYLPEETRIWLDELAKSVLPKEKKERKVPAKRKAPATKSDSGSKRRRKRAKSDDEDEDDADENGGESSDVDRDDEEMDVDEPPKKAVPANGSGRRRSARGKGKGRASSPEEQEGEEEEEEEEEKNAEEEEEEEETPRAKRGTRSSARNGAPGKKGKTGTRGKGRGKRRETSPLTEPSDEEE